MAAETPEIVAPSQPTQQAASQRKKRKADDSSSSTPASPPSKAKKAKKSAVDTPTTTTPDAAEMPSEHPAGPTAKKTASQPKKRKAAEDDSSAGAAPSKKTKKENSKPAAKPRQTKRTKKAVEEPPPPQVPSPAEVTAPVQASIDAVKRFMATEMVHEETLLERDPENSSLVSIPQLDLFGVVMTMYLHYQLPDAETEVSFNDVWDAAITTFKKPIGTSGYEADFVTLDLSRPTTLENRIKEKIANHGLEDTNLLEIEMELCARRNMAQHKVYQSEAEEIMRARGLLKELVEEGWYGNGKLQRQIEAGRITSEGEKEVGRNGVCPAKTVELV